MSQLTSDDHRLLGSASGTLLIVDDDDTTRSAVTRWFSLEGYSVVGAATGSEGLSVAARVSPRVILLDYRLPDMTGIECLERLRDGCCGRSPTVILFTADVNVYDEQDALRSLDATVAFKLCDLRYPWRSDRGGGTGEDELAWQATPQWPVGCSSVLSIEV